MDKNKEKILTFYKIRIAKKTTSKTVARFENYNTLVTSNIIMV